MDRRVGGLMMGRWVGEWVDGWMDIDGWVGGVDVNRWLMDGWVG